MKKQKLLKELKESIESLRECLDEMILMAALNQNAIEEIGAEESESTDIAMPYFTALAAAIQAKLLRENPEYRAKISQMIEMERTYPFLMELLNQEVSFDLTESMRRVFGTYLKTAQEKSAYELAEIYDLIGVMQSGNTGLDTAATNLEV